MFEMRLYRKSIRSKDACDANASDRTTSAITKTKKMLLNNKSVSSFYCFQFLIAVFDFLLNIFRYFTHHFC